MQMAKEWFEEGIKFLQLQLVFAKNKCQFALIEESQFMKFYSKKNIKKKSVNIYNFDYPFYFIFTMFNSNCAFLLVSFPLMRACEQ